MKGSLYKLIYSYLNTQRLHHKLTMKHVNEMCGVKARCIYYFGLHQFEFILEEHDSILQQHMDLKPYNDIKQEYESLLRTFKLTSDKPYNNTRQ